MKRTLIAAATLLLGTSALTAASAQDKYDKEAAFASKKTSAVELTDNIVAAKVDEAAAMKNGSEHLGMGGPLEDSDEISFTDKPVLAEKYVETDPIVLAKYEQAVALKSAPSSTGTGGPFEEADATADLAPRPSADNYPPCSPGPGDDRCIQLYEPGVRAQLASWNRATGGLDDGSMKTAMGGPYEPVDGALNSDGTADKIPAEFATHTDVASHHEFAGVGGPIEAQSGYPACSPGPGDDRCIQLYEPGVTGAGN